MSILSTNKFRNVLALSLFLVGQTFAVAHAVGYGAEPHQHNGIVCLGILTGEQEGLAPSSQLATFSRLLETVESVCISDQPPLLKQFACKPPPTGPPLV